MKKFLALLPLLIFALSVPAWAAEPVQKVEAVGKFEAHKDNPDQVPIGAPAGVVAAGAILVKAPSVINVAGYTADQVNSGETGTASQDADGSFKIS